MKNFTIREGTLFIGLIALGIAGRFMFRDLPNFTPTAAVALFAGFFFSSRSLAALVPIMVLTASNLFLPLYNHWGEMAAVYAAFLFPLALRPVLRRELSMLRLGVCAALPSIVFFAVTNFAVWACSGFYEPSWAGLIECYTSAIPFYRYMLAGDLLFSGALFGLYALAVLISERRELVRVPVPREPRK